MFLFVLVYFLQTFCYGAEKAILPAEQTLSPGVEKALTLAKQPLNPFDRMITKDGELDPIIYQCLRRVAYSFDYQGMHSVPDKEDIEKLVAWARWYFCKGGLYIFNNEKLHAVEGIKKYFKMRSLDEFDPPDEDESDSPDEDVRESPFRGKKFVIPGGYAISMYSLAMRVLPADLILVVSADRLLTEKDFAQVGQISSDNAALIQLHKKYKKALTAHKEWPKVVYRALIGEDWSDCDFSNIVGVRASFGKVEKEFNKMIAVYEEWLNGMCCRSQELTLAKHIKKPHRYKKNILCKNTQKRPIQKMIKEYWERPNDVAKFRAIASYKEWLPVPVWIKKEIAKLTQTPLWMKTKIPTRPKTPQTPHFKALWRKKALWIQTALWIKKEIATLTKAPRLTPRWIKKAIVKLTEPPRLTPLLYERNILRKVKKQYKRCRTQKVIPEYQGWLIQKMLEESRERPNAVANSRAIEATTKCKEWVIQKNIKYYPENPNAFPKLLYKKWPNAVARFHAIASYKKWLACEKHKKWLKSEKAHKKWPNAMARFHAIASYKKWLECEKHKKWLKSFKKWLPSLDPWRVEAYKEWIEGVSNSRVHKKNITISKKYEKIQQRESRRLELSRGQDLGRRRQKEKFPQRPRRLTSLNAAHHFSIWVKGVSGAQVSIAAHKKFIPAAEYATKFSNKYFAVRQKLGTFPEKIKYKPHEELEIELSRDTFLAMWDKLISSLPMKFEHEGPDSFHRSMLLLKKFCDAKNITFDGIIVANPHGVLKKKRADQVFGRSIPFYDGFEEESSNKLYLYSLASALYIEAENKGYLPTEADYLSLKEPWFPNGLIFDSCVQAFIHTMAVIDSSAPPPVEDFYSKQLQEEELPGLGSIPVEDYCRAKLPPDFALVASNRCA